MLQIISQPKHAYLQTSTAALVAIVLAIGAFLGRVYHLFEPGPSSLTAKLFLLAVALFAFSIGTEELRLHRGDETANEATGNRPVVAMLAQRIGFIQTALGGVLLALTVF